MLLCNSFTENYSLSFCHVITSSPLIPLHYIKLGSPSIGIYLISVFQYLSVPLSLDTTNWSLEELS